MRRFRAIVFATVLELLSEPLVLLVAVTASALSALAPAVHYHQFGDPTRMARDAGLSMLLVGGFVIAIFGAIKTLRREIEGGTALSALAHSVSRTSFFLAKTVGVALTYLLFATEVTCCSLTVVKGTLIGAALNLPVGRLAAIWGPSLAFALASPVVSLVAAAALNRFARFRFTLTANLTALALAVLSVAYRLDTAHVFRMLPVFALTALPALVPLTAAAAFASRFRTNVAASAALVASALFLPALGSYCLGDVLTDGGSLPGGYFWLALGAVVPPTATCLLVGSLLFGGKDIS